MVVQAPTPPTPTETAPQTLPRVTPEPPPSRAPHPKRAEVKSPPEEETAEVPALQSALSPSQASELRSRVLRLQEGIEKRITLLSKEWLSPGERSTLEGARGFLQQSQKALQESDLQRADNLAHKADVLVTSVEQSR